MSNQPTNTRTRTKKSRFSEGIILGTVPVMVYALGFVYEMGHLSFYGIPSSLIAIDAPAMISATLFGAVYVLALLLWLSIALDSSVSEYNIVKSIGLLMLYFGFFPLIYILIQGPGSFIIALYSSIGAMLLIVILRSVEMRSKWLQKVSERVYRILDEAFPLEKNEGDKQTTTFQLLQNGIGMVVMISIPFVLAFAAGKHNAEGLTSYDVFDHKQQGKYAVIRIYNDKVVSIPINKEKLFADNKYAIFKIDNLDGVVFSSQNIGPLTKVSAQDND